MLLKQLKIKYKNKRISKHKIFRHFGGYTRSQIIRKYASRKMCISCNEGTIRAGKGALRAKKDTIRPVKDFNSASSFN